MPLDETRGKAAIAVETRSTVAIVTFWNTGAVEVLTVDKAARREFTLDDRVLTPANNIESLLNRYFQQTIEPAV